MYAGGKSLKIYMHAYRIAGSLHSQHHWWLTQAFLLRGS